MLNRNQDSAESTDRLAQNQAATDARATLGQRLRALRSQIVASGEKLLTPEEIDQEIAEQRDRLAEFEQCHK